MTNDDIRRKARGDYVFRRMNGTTIASLYKISPSTFGRWKKQAKAKGDDWDMSRSASIIAGEGMDAVVSSVVEDFMLLAQGLLENIKSGELDVDQKVKHLVSLADAMTKMTSAAGKLAPKISELGVAQDVIRELLEFVRKEYPAHSRAFVEVIEPFGETLTGIYG